jgi:transcriptional regulator
MYSPKPFDVTDVSMIQDLIREQALGQWITLAEGELLANPVPFLLDTTRGEYGTLVGHVARANPVWQAFSREVESLVLFQGPQAYVSPAWYASKAVHGKVVPTWNYAVVQARGLPCVIEEPTALRGILAALTDRHEGGRAAPWHLDDAPADFTDTLLTQIVGIEIPLTRLTGKWKVSQNRPAADRAGVVAGLQSEADPQARAMAALVAQRGG